MNDCSVIQIFIDLSKTVYHTLPDYLQKKKRVKDVITFQLIIEYLFILLIHRLVCVFTLLLAYPTNEPSMQFSRELAF